MDQRTLITLVQQEQSQAEESGEEISLYHLANVIADAQKEVDAKIAEKDNQYVVAAEIRLS